MLNCSCCIGARVFQRARPNFCIHFRFRRGADPPKQIHHHEEGSGNNYILKSSGPAEYLHASAIYV